MSYTLLAAIAAVLAALVDLAALRTMLLLHKGFWASYAIMTFFQLVTNGLLTGLPIVRYDPDRIIGWRVVYAPVEDLLFGFSLITATLSLWVWAGRRDARARPAAHR